MRYKFVLLGLILFVLFLNPVLGEEKNITLEEQAVNCLNESNQIMNELINQSFSFLRVNDTIREAESIYGAQIVLKDKKKSNDFSLVLPYCEQIKNIRKLAFDSRDQLIALEKFYNDSLTSDMNTTEVDLLISQIEGEIKSERYEKVMPLVDQTYSKIIEVKSEYTTLNLFYKNTTRGLKSFFYENWIYIISFVIVALLLFLLYKTSITRWWIRRKLAFLEIRRKTIKNLIMQTQRNYFERGNISEGEFNIKIKKFAEMIRDIDRQIPLLKEELLKVNRKLKTPNKK